MKGRLILATVATAAVLSAGCGVTRGTSDPACSASRVEPLYLVSQSVTTAAQVPCVTAYPGGWKLGSFDVHNGQASFSLDSDRGGAKALTVTLRKTCAVDGAIQVASDKPGTSRFDQMPDVSDGFRGVRSYRFDGGCVTYRFNVRSQRAGTLVDEGSLAIGFVSRAEVQARMDAAEGS